MINKIKAWPIGGKIAGGIIGGIVGLFLLLSIIAFFSGMIRGIINGPQKVASANAEDYYSYHSPKIVKLDQDMTMMVTDIVKMSQGDSSSATMTDFNIQSATIDRDIIDLQAYKGSVPSEYSKADGELTDALVDLQGANNNLSGDISSNNINSFLADAQAIGEGRSLLKQAVEDMIVAHDKQ